MQAHQIKLRDSISECLGVVRCVFCVSPRRRARTLAAKIARLGKARCVMCVLSRPRGANMGESVFDCVAVVRCIFCVSSRRNARLTAAKVARLVATGRPLPKSHSQREVALSQRSSSLLTEGALSRREVAALTICEARALWQLAKRNRAPWHLMWSEAARSRSSIQGPPLPL